MHVVLTALPGVLPALRRELERAGLGETAEPLPLRAQGDAEELGLEVPRTAAGVAALGELRTAVAAHLVVTTDAPRPTGLLSSESLGQLDQALEVIAWQRPRVRFSGLRLEAAGSDTPQMQRVAEGFAERAGVPVADDGDLVVRVRRTTGGAPGWDALVRTTPRPLATRAWRTERYPGALNATIAAAVVDELGVSADDAFGDLMCGSGTLVIERMARGPARRILAVDQDPHALEVLTTHLRAARVRGRVEQLVADVRDLARPTTAVPDGVANVAPGSLTRVVVNPPWGELLGEHETNDALYADLLDAVDRVGAPDVRAGVLTHDIRRFEAVLTRDRRWREVARPQYFAKGHRPRLFVLERSARTGGP